MYEKYTATIKHGKILNIYTEVENNEKSVLNLSNIVPCHCNIVIGKEKNK